MKKSNSPNSMSPEEFEKRLQQRPLRGLPAEWRAEILASAKKAATGAATVAIEKPSAWSVINSWVSVFLSSRREMRAGLAAIWFLIFALRFTMHDEPHDAGKKTTVSHEAIAAAREQRLFYAELAGLREAHDAEPPKSFLPRPRSERRDQILTA
jgi:hypothetical protein